MKSVFVLVLLLGLLISVYNADAQEPSHKLLKAIARQESGMNPLAINVAGKSFHLIPREKQKKLSKKHRQQENPMMLV